MRTLSINMQLNNVEYVLVASSITQIEIHTPLPKTTQRGPHISDRCYFFPASPLSLISTSPPNHKSIYLYSIITTSGLEGFSALIEDPIYTYISLGIFTSRPSPFLQFLHLLRRLRTTTTLYPPPCLSIREQHHLTSKHIDYTHCGI